MTNKESLNCRHFVTYSGVKLPLKLVSPLDKDTLDGRITYFRGFYNDDDNLLKVEKVVYGEIEFTHNYEYHDDGRLKSFELIEQDEEPRVIQYE